MEVWNEGFNMMLLLRGVIYLIDWSKMFVQQNLINPFLGRDRDRLAQSGESLPSNPAQPRFFELLWCKKSLDLKRILHSTQLSERDMDPKQIGPSGLSRWARKLYNAMLATRGRHISTEPNKVRWSHLMGRSKSQAKSRDIYVRPPSKRGKWERG